MAEVIEINDIHELGAYRLEWTRLLGETPNATFFQTFDWLSIYWQHYGDDQALRVLVVRAAGQTIGIVPLVVRRRYHRVGVVRTLTYPLEDWGTRFGPLGANPAATLALAMKHIATTPRDWDRIELDWVTHDTSDRGRTQRAMELAGMKPHCRPSGCTSLIELAGSWEAYLQSLTSKRRSEARRKIRRTEEIRGAEYVRYRPQPRRAGQGDPNWDLYDQCEQIALASWQSQTAKGNTLGHDAYRDFYRDTHAAAARLGMLDLNLLRIDGRPAAFLYNYVADGRLYGLRMGYDPEVCQSHAVGIGLLKLCLRDSCQRGDSELDMGPGNQSYKRRIRTRVTHYWRVGHTPLASVRGQAVRIGQWLRREAQSA